MIRTVGVTQVKYCYRMNINSVQIQFIQYAFHSNQLKAEDASKMTCKSHKSRLARARILLSRLEAGTLPNLVSATKRNSTFNTMRIPRMIVFGHVMGM